MQKNITWMLLLAVFVDVAADCRVVVTIRALKRLDVTMSMHDPELIARKIQYI